MKKLFLSILLCAGLFQSLSAQVYKKGNMTLYAGLGASNVVANALNSVGEGAANSVGPYILGYQYHLTDKLMIGLAYTYQSASTGKQTVTTATDNVSFRTNLNVSTFLSQINYSWYNNENQALILYSGAALGTFSIDSELELVSGNKDLAVLYNGLANGMSYHINAIGYKGRFTKSSKLGAFAELGFGMNGIFNAGLQYTFN
jgi:hypothetical protein